jgi:hypothetical protein
MTNRHQAQFIGQDLLPGFHFTVTSNTKSDSEMDDNHLPEQIDETSIRAGQQMIALNYIRLS